MKIALLSKYTRLGASSRLRTYQYISGLREADISVQVFPLFDDAYLMSLYGGKGRSSRAVFGYYRNRIQSFCKFENVDLIWLEKEAFPYVPYWLEKIFVPKHIPIVVDYDDAIFHNYDLSKNFFVRLALGRKIDKIMSSASTVICGNEYLAIRAKKAGAKKIKIMPTVVDKTRYRVNLKNKNDIPVIGWVGSPSTQKYLLEIQSVLKNVCANGLARLVLVGVTPDISKKFPGIQIQTFDWNEDTEPSQIADFDIGIMPLIDEPWERGKSGYKLIQYMACGLPLVASPVGVNSEIVQHNENGFLATTNQEWEESLLELIHSFSMRQLFGKAGRLMVEEKYSIQSQAPHLIKILRSAADQV